MEKFPREREKRVTGLHLESYNLETQAGYIFT